MCDIVTLKKIANCLEVPAGKIALNDEKVIFRTSKNKTITGFATILNALSKESQKEIALNSCSTLEIEAQVYQWAEFSLLYIAPGSKKKAIAQQLLRDLNKLFLNKSYVLGNCITVADLIVFYSIYELMGYQTPIEKETYINLSRWFDHIQQTPEVRSQGVELLNFSTIYLHGWVTGTHI